MTRKLTDALGITKGHEQALMEGGGYDERHMRLPDMMDALTDLGVTGPLMPYGQLFSDSYEYENDEMYPIY